MTARLASGLLVNALVRRADQAGGSAMVLAKGDANAGAILVLTVERGAHPRFFERGMGADGNPALTPAGPADFADEAAVSAYWQRRRSHDRDLWVVELDVPEGQRFVAETFALD